MAGPGGPACCQINVGRGRLRQRALSTRRSETPAGFGRPRGSSRPVDVGRCKEGTNKNVRGGGGGGGPLFHHARAESRLLALNNNASLEYTQASPLAQATVYRRCRLALALAKGWRNRRCAAASRWRFAGAVSLSFVFPGRCRAGRASCAGLGLLIVRARSVGGHRALTERTHRASRIPSGCTFPLPHLQCVIRIEWHY